MGNKILIKFVRLVKMKIYKKIYFISILKISILLLFKILVLV